MEQKNRPLVVHHYHPVGSRNVGEQLLARALRASVQKYFGPAEFLDIPVNQCYHGAGPVGLVHENVSRSNAEADLVLIGGSNLLEPRQRTASEPRASGWGVSVDSEAIGRLSRPVMLVGLGTGSEFGSHIGRYSARAREEIRLLHMHSVAAAVRDMATAQRLAQIGVQADCVGSPSTFWTDRPVAPGDPQLPLIVSFPPSRILSRFGGKRFMSQAMQYVEWLRTSSVRVVVTVHEAADLDVVYQWVPWDTEVFYTHDVDELIARYENSRGVIGFRLQAALLGLGLGKPAILVGLDWRGLAAIQTFGLQHYSIRAFRWAQFLKLRQLTDMLLRGDPALVGRLDLVKARFSARYETFFREAACRLTGACGEDELARLAPHPVMLRSREQTASGQKRVA